MSRTLPRVKTLAQILMKLRLIWVILIAFFLLSGCVRSDIGIRFSDANHGKLVQHIHLSQPATGLESAVVDAWLERLEHEAVALGGRVQHPSAQELKLTIPFFNTKDLEAKFNQLFQSELQPSTKPSRRSPQTLSHPTTQPSPILSHLKVRSGNWILWQRLVLNYELDLRSLDRLLSPRKLPLNLRKLLDLEFSVTAQDLKIIRSSNPAPVIRKKGRQLVWSLQPGEINQLQAVFWVPSPLGIGTVMIVLFVLLGIWFKTQPPNALTRS